MMETTGERSYDTSHDEIPTAVTHAIAEHEDVDPRALETPLYDVIDPDALDALFTTENSTVVHVTFSYEGYDVRVTSDGGVHISDRDEQ